MKKLILAILLLVTLLSLVACAPENETTARPTPAPPRVDGLFDADGNRLASWDALVNEYGFDMKNEDDKESSQLAQIIERNEEALGTAVKLVVGDGRVAVSAVPHLFPESRQAPGGKPKVCELVVGHQE